jgi:hypothetical protein
MDSHRWRAKSIAEVEQQRMTRTHHGSPGFVSIVLLSVTMIASVAAPLAWLPVAPDAGLSGADADASFLAAHQPEGRDLAGSSAFGVVIALLVIVTLVLLILVLARRI